MDRFYVFFVLSAIAAHLCTASKFEDCGSTAKVNSVNISGCPDSADVCPLIRGTDASITIAFKSNSDAKSLKAVVYGIISFVPLPFPLPQSDGCKSGVSCPVQNGQSYIYSNKLKVRKSYPSLSVTVKWMLKDEKSNNLVCIKIPCKLQ
ncbi:NPC intracellular cholesterol transporter 2-like [Stegodyphus dumicola]|uniref:NPC intracellular cholesterol transporter 2-like n=1 Tax=Stegodyphus dumicola TaxID=202533 RepID=UPI0015A7E5AD|nr:NPC intracellular cholesterol transporter 2-like [Stegodyphus dumicola]